MRNYEGMCEYANRVQWYYNKKQYQNKEFQYQIRR